MALLDKFFGCGGDIDTGEGALAECVGHSWTLNGLVQRTGYAGGSLRNPRPLINSHCSTGRLHQ